MNETTTPNHNGGRIGRSIGAVIAGLLFIFVTHTGADVIMHSIGVFPPLGEPMTDPREYGIALAYRIVLSVIGCYIAAWLAPHHPLRHALILGGIGVLLSTAGAIAMWDLGNHWYSVALILIALPCAWLGGWLRDRQLVTGIRGLHRRG